MIAPRQTTAEAASTDASGDHVVELCNMFKVLCDENRLRIVLQVGRDGEQNVTELCQLVQLPQPLVSHHLARLREAGILQTRREGKRIYYSLQRARFEQLMSLLAGRSERRPPCDRFLECMIG